MKQLERETMPSRKDAGTQCVYWFLAPFLARQFFERNCTMKRYVFSLAIAGAVLSVTAPKALSENYRFEKIADTPASDFGGSYLPYIDEQGIVSLGFYLDAVAERLWSSLADYGIPLDDSGDFQIFYAPDFNLQNDATYFSRIHSTTDVSGIHRV